MDARTLGRYKKLLLEEKQRILNNTRSPKAEDVNISADDLADETDLAASTINQNLVYQLQSRERAMLVKIEEALARIDDGEFGICGDCEEAIEPKRLDVRPVTTLCLACKERQEHREKIYA